jgi:hypothetical protein
MGAFLMISLRCIPGYGWIATCALIAVLTSPLSSAAEGETVCIQCHTAQTGRGHEPVKPWQGSIHAENGISCHNCHGGDSKDIVNAMNPERGFLGAPKERLIPDFCGRCHIGIKAYFLRSAHGRALGKGGPVCITCHGSHDIKKASLDLINEKSCTRCHSYDRARLIRGAMEKTETSLAGLAQRIEAFKGKGVDTAALEKSLFSQRNHYRSLFHEVDVAKVNAESSRIAAELNTIKVSLDKIDAEHQRRNIIGLFAVGACLLAALLLHQLHKTYS